MKYKVAIYADDYMLLSELVSKIELNVPLAEIMVFATNRLEKELENTAVGYLIDNIERIAEADILIMLSKPDNPSKFITDFEGTIIDTTGFDFRAGAEVFTVQEPIELIFRNIDIPLERISATLQLPVSIFGQKGVEDLMGQTRDIFAFQSRDNLIIDERIAFNVHFNPSKLDSLKIGETLEILRVEGADISTRLLPLSTAFIIDTFADGEFGLVNYDGYLETPNFFTAEDMPEEEVLTIRHRSGYTFAGDYLRLYVLEIVKKLKEVMN